MPEPQFAIIPIPIPFDNFMENLEIFKEFRKRFMEDPEFAAERITERTIRIHDALIEAFMQLDTTVRIQADLPEAFQRARIDIEQLTAARNLLLEAVGHINEVYSPADPESIAAQKDCRESIAALRLELAREASRA